jgi:hypothetical protein
MGMLEQQKKQVDGVMDNEAGQERWIQEVDHLKELLAMQQQPGLEAEVSEVAVPLAPKERAWGQRVDLDVSALIRP